MLSEMSMYKLVLDYITSLYQLLDQYTTGMTCLRGLG